MNDMSKIMKQRIEKFLLSFINDLEENFCLMVAYELVKIPNPQRIKVKQEITNRIFYYQMQQETKLMWETNIFVSHLNNQMPNASMSSFSSFASTSSSSLLLNPQPQDQQSDKPRNMSWINIVIKFGSNLL